MPESHRELESIILSAVTGETSHEDSVVRRAVDEVIAALDRGELRVAEKSGGSWRTHAWVKHAILFYFRNRKMEKVTLGPFEYRDKIPLKTDLESQGVRVVPPGVARYGSHLEPGVIMMPGYVNIGAYVGSGSMVDTFCKKAPTRIASNRSMLSLTAQVSVPRATTTPASSILWTGAMPRASFMWHSGLYETEVPVSFRRWMSSSESQMQ